MTKSIFSSFSEVEFLLLTRLIEVLELRHQDDSEGKRAHVISALEEIRQARNALVHGQDEQTATTNMSHAASRLLRYLHLLEASSLGDPQAQQIRRSASARHIADVLDRVPSPIVEHEEFPSLPDLEKSPQPPAEPPSRSRGGERPLSEVRFLTVAEAATVMRVSQMTIRREVESGELPAIRVGRSLRIPEQAVHDYLRDLGLPVSDEHERAQSPGHATTGEQPTELSVALKGADQRARPTETRGGERPLSEIQFLSVAEAATVMRVSKMTVYRLVHSGQLPAIRVGRSFRIPRQAIEDYIASEPR